MANSVTLEEQHLDRQPPTVAIQATTWWEIGLALVKLQGCGLEVHLSVEVSAYHINHINLCAHSTCRRAYCHDVQILAVTQQFCGHIQSSKLTMLQCSASTQQAHSLPDKTAERAMTQSRSIPLRMCMQQLSMSLQ